jgi:hypothetical protein
VAVFSSLKPLLAPFESMHDWIPGPFAPSAHEKLDGTS